MAICLERRYGNIIVRIDDSMCAKTPEDKTRIDQNVYNILYKIIFTDPKKIDKLRKLNFEKYGSE